MVAPHSKRWLAAAAAAAGLALSGCAGSAEPQAGVAAKVGGETVSVSFVQDRAQTLTELRPKGAPVDDQQLGQLQLQIIEQSVMGHLLRELAEREDVRATAAEIGKAEDQLRQQAKQRGQKMPSDLLSEVARLNVLTQKLPKALLGKQPANRQEQAEMAKAYQQKMSAVAKDLGVEINPRYGSWSSDPNFVGRAPLINPEGGALVEFQSPSPEPPQIPRLPQSGQG